MKSKIKPPIKPERPDKPYPPNKDKKFNKHSIDVDHLFFQTTYFDDDGKKITKEAYENGRNTNPYAFEAEEEELTPSLKQILECVPTGTKLEDIHIELRTTTECPGRWPMTVLEGTYVFYTTPFDYEGELEKYNKAMAKYEADLNKYKQKMEKYKEEFAEYKALKEQEKLVAKKAKLQAELASLNERV